MMTDATVPPKVGFVSPFGTTVCNVNHINAGGEPRPIAGATQERTLLGVGPSAWFGGVRVASMRLSFASCRGQSLELEFHTHPVWIVDEKSRAVAPFHRTTGDLDPGLSQVRDDVVDRRSIHSEAEMIDADGILFAGRDEFGMGKDVEFLAPYLYHCGP